MEAMYELIEQLGAACTRQYDYERAQVYRQKPLPPPDANNPNSHVLSLLPTRSHTSQHSDYFTSHTAAAFNTSSLNTSLYSVFFLSASLPMLTIRCDTGQVLDVNSQALALSGWSAQSMIGKRITAPYDYVMSPTRTKHDDKMCCSNDLGYDGQYDAIIVDEQDCVVGESHEHDQYETSNELERKLYGGELSVIQPVWRLRLKDGGLHELTVTQWCGDWTDVVDSKGGSRRQPTYVVYLIAPESIIRVE